MEHTQHSKSHSSRIVEMGEGNFYYETLGYIDGEKHMLYIKDVENKPRFVNGVRVE